MKKKFWVLALVLIAVLLAGCGNKDVQTEAEVTPTPTIEAAPIENALTEAATPTPTPAPEAAPAPVEPVVIEPEIAEGEEITEEPENTEETSNGYLVVIDAGHQDHGNYDQEPVGPGASEMKAKVSSGTQGVSTGLPEYKLNLSVSLKLRDELISRGYEVIMVRESHDVDISNSERAAVANNANADVFIRVHANGADDSSVNGMITICQTPDNPYNGHLYPQSQRLSRLVLDEMAAATGASANYIWETDTMSGINWAQVPTTIVEMGYMTNPAEDQLLASDAYQYKIADGIANGIDLYLGVTEQ